MAENNNNSSQDVSLRYFPGQKRSQPMEVLALNISRTGTMSMARALERLGYTHCAHGFDMFDDPSDHRWMIRWSQLVHDKFHKGISPTKDDFDELLGHCRAATDFPIVLFWRELCEAYPDAKIVLVQRNEKKWFMSFDKMVITNYYSTFSLLKRHIIYPMAGNFAQTYVHNMFAAWLDGRGARHWAAHALPAYRRHYDEIRATIPQDRILEFQLAEGWKPLCWFLGQDVPDEEFPRLNDGESMTKYIQDTDRALTSMLVKRTLGVAVLVTACSLAYAYLPQGAS